MLKTGAFQNSAVVKESFVYEEDDSSDVSSDILQPLAVSTDSLVSTESLVACTESLVVSTESLAPSTEL